MISLKTKNAVLYNSDLPVPNTPMILSTKEKMVIYSLTSIGVGPVKRCRATTIAKPPKAMKIDPKASNHQLVKRNMPFCIPVSELIHD